MKSWACLTSVISEWLWIDSEPIKILLVHQYSLQDPWQKLAITFISTSLQGEREGSEKILAYHGAEIPYVFNTHDAFLPTTEEDLKLTEQMMEYWTEFAKKGTPNSVNNPVTWYEFGEEENYLILDTEVRNDQKLERQFCDIMIEKLMQSAASE